MLHKIKDDPTQGLSRLKTGYHPVTTIEEKYSRFVNLIVLELSGMLVCDQQLIPQISVGQLSLIHCLNFIIFFLTCFSINQITFDVCIFQT